MKSHLRARDVPSTEQSDTPKDLRRLRFDGLGQPNDFGCRVLGFEALGYRNLRFSGGSYIVIVNGAGIVIVSGANEFSRL